MIFLVLLIQMPLLLLMLFLLLMQELMRDGRSTLSDAPLGLIEADQFEEEEIYWLHGLLGVSQFSMPTKHEQSLPSFKALWREAA